MSAISRPGTCCCLLALFAIGASAFECTSDVRLGASVSAAKKGIALDDSTLRWCTSQIPRAWPNSESAMTSIRLFKAWDASWGDAGREAAWDGLVAYVTNTGAKVLIGTAITCSEQADDQVWGYTKQLIQRLQPSHVMGLAIGNEVELLQFKGADVAPQSCLTEIWDNGYYWRKYQQYVSEFNAMGFGSIKITAVFTGMGLGGNPFYEVPGKARVKSLLQNVTGLYGARFAFTWNFYPYFDPNMRLDAGTQSSCSGALGAASCWGTSCVVPAQLRDARAKQEALTGRSDSLLWLGETGWSSPMSTTLKTELRLCPAWSSAETFQRFYQGFLEWDLQLGGGAKPPDHVFWFTMRDASNFGEQEHFGLVANCNEPKCKVKSSGYAPFLYDLHLGPAKTACGDATLYNGWAYGGQQTCQNMCEIDGRCNFYGIWPHSHDNHHWCRLTATCDSTASDANEVSTYEKRPAPGTSTSTGTATLAPTATATPTATGTKTTSTGTPSTTQTEAAAQATGAANNTTTGANDDKEEVSITTLSASTRTADTNAHGRCLLAALVVACFTAVVRT